MSEIFGILGNSVFGQAEEKALVAQFSTREKAIEYERASRLPEPEIVKLPMALFSFGRINYHEFILSYHHNSLLRWFNPWNVQGDPDEPDIHHRLPMIISLGDDYVYGIPIDPVLNVNVTPETW